MSISAPFIARPRATGLLALTLLALGLIGYFKLPVSALPDVDLPTIIVTTQLPGASAPTISTQVTAPLEQELGQISGLRRIYSTSSNDMSQIVLQFDLSRGMDGITQDLQAAISAAQGVLPKSLPYPPVYSKINPADTPIITLALTSTKLSLDKICDAAETLLQPRLSEIDGVGRVTVEGGLRPAIRIRVDPARLASYGLALDDIRNAIANASVNGSKGGFDGAKQAVFLGANDQLESPNEYKDLIVAWRNQAAIHLSDVGSVVSGLENNRVDARLIMASESLPAVFIDVQRQPNANIVQTVSRINQLLPTLRTILPSAIKMSIISDRSDGIRAALGDVKFTLLLAVLLVIIVNYLFLGTVRTSLIAATALSLSIVSTFGAMSALGFSLNNFSLMALVVAAGFVVDDAIIVIENATRHIEQGAQPLLGTYEATKEIGFTIVSLTLSLVAVFIPILFMGGVAGRLFAEFSETLCIAVLVSGLLSLTLTPMMCSRMIHLSGKDKLPVVPRHFSRLLITIQTLYRRSLRASLRHQTEMLILTCVTLLLTIGLYYAVPKSFLPNEDTGRITIVTEGRQDVSVARMKILQNKAADILRSDPAVRLIQSVVGVDAINLAPNTGRLTIILKPPHLRDNAIQVIERLRSRLAKFSDLNFYIQQAQDIHLGISSAGGQFQYTLTDNNFRELAQWAPHLVRAMRGIPKLTDVTSDLLAGGVASYIRIDRAAALRLGVTVEAIENTLYDAFGQRPISTIFQQSNQYRVVLEALPTWQENPRSLLLLRVPGTNDAQIPLSEIATITPISAPLLVTRQQQMPCVTVNFNLAPGGSLEAAEKAIAQAQARLKMPAGIVGSYSGEALEFRHSLNSEPLLILTAIAAIYVVLGILYENLIHPISILSTLPSAGSGALLALLFFKIDLSLISLLGIILLMGIVKKNAILIVDFAIHAERERGLTPIAAIEEGSVLRLRPILMTTATALFATLPLIFERGRGSEFRSPLGIAVVGGLLLSQLLTLYTTPSIYLALGRFRATSSVFNALRGSPRANSP